MASPINPNAGLVRQYGLESLPESVVHLTRLVSRQDATAEEIAKILSKDKVVSARLLRFANPGAECEQDYTFTTVEEALLRTGMAPVILLAMIDPVVRAVVKASSMFETPLIQVPLSDLSPFSGSHVLATVEFAGKGTGAVQVRVTSEAAQAFAAEVMKIPPEEMTDEAVIDDVVGELVNIIAGNLQSNLCDAGISCRLSAPQVCRVTTFRKQGMAGHAVERLGFEGSGMTAFVDVCVNPWSDN